MKKFEHKEEIYRMSASVSWVQWLNIRGNEGWEVVDVLYDGRVDCSYVTFKREI